MSFNDAFLPEFDLEMERTRRTLERVPESKADWRPHPKSSSLGNLAAHLATLPTYGTTVATSDEVDMADANRARPPRLIEPTSALLAAFDRGVSEARAAIAAMPENTLGRTWTLRAGSQVIFAIPRAAALRTFLMSHMIHHRAQLGVYLRLNGIPVPSIYGPSADENPFG